MFEPAARSEADELVVRRIVSGAEVTLELVGELDAAGVDPVLEAATQLPADGHLTIDMSQLTFMDSSGIRVLMSLDLRRRAEGWELTLLAPQPQVLRVLRLCGFEDRFEIRR